VFYGISVVCLVNLDVPRDKNLGVLNKENEQAVLFVHLVLSVVLWKVGQEFPKCKKKMWWTMRDPELILVCRSTYCNSFGKAFL